MNTQISVHDKKLFLRWFLSNYQLKKRESVWILNYLFNHESVLEDVRFVREVRGCPRGLVITAQCSEEAAFRFCKNHIITTDAEKSYHDIRMNRSEPVYIQLNFKNNHQSPEYAAVMEENPYDEQDSLTINDMLSVEYILDRTLYTTQKKLIMEEIDNSLDKRDYARFERASELLEELENRYGKLNIPGNMDSYRL